MKKIVFVLLVLAIVLAACGPSDSQCNLSKMQFTDYDDRPLTAMEVNLILNNNFPPGTVGAMLQDCINNGWDGYR